MRVITHHRRDIMRCLEHMKIVEILRLKAMNIFTYREIAQSVGCSKTSVGDVLSRCKECGLDYESARSMSADEINKLVYPESFGPKQVKDEPDWDTIHARLQASKKTNLQFIWENDYRPLHPDGYSYSRFCAKYSIWKKKSGHYRRKLTKAKRLLISLRPATPVTGSETALSGYYPIKIAPQMKSAMLFLPS